MMNFRSAVFLACGFPAAGMMSVASSAGAEILPDVLEKSLPADESEKSLNEQLELFDKTMEPGYLDEALKIVKGMPDHDAQGKLLSERHLNRLKAMLRIFHAATKSIDANYIPEMARLEGKRDIRPLPVPSPMPDKVAGRYLYDYIQSGLRVFRFQLRVDILNCIRSAYQGIPSPEERRDLLAAAQGLDAEFISLLGDFMQMDVSWELDKRRKMPGESGWKDSAGFLEGMVCCMRHMRFLERAMDPLYLPDDYPCMNISPPFPAAPDIISVAGQSPDSVKNPESRRQYLIALRENRRKTQGVEVSRGLKKQMSDMTRAFFDRFGHSKLLDGPGMQTLWQAAEQAGMSDRFMHNLKEARAVREIDLAVMKFEKTKDRQFLVLASSMLETFQPCSDRMNERNFFSNFQLERGLRLYHAVSSDPAFKDGETVKKDLEENMMAHIFKTCGKYRSGLMDARWWFKAYGMRKPLIERIDQALNNVLEEEKQGIEKQLTAVERNFTPEAFKQADRLVDRLWDKNHSMRDILDFKVRCRFRLLPLLEARLDPDYSINPPEGYSMSLPEGGLILKRCPNPPFEGYDAKMQLRLHEMYSSFHDNLLYTLESCYEESRETQKGALLLVQEMKVKPEVMQRLQMKFDQRNLRESLSDLEYKKKGDPEVIAAEIDRIYRNEDVSPSDLIKMLRARFSNQMNLFGSWRGTGARSLPPLNGHFVTA